MKEQILSILNDSPHELNSGRAMRIADAQMVVPISDISPNDLNANERWIAERDSRALAILQSFEAFKKMRLEKGHFVCERDAPIIPDTIRVEIYESALKKVIFAGFKQSIDLPRIYSGSGILIELVFYDDGNVGVFIKGVCIAAILNATIGDLLTEIERYNRTATSPIHLEYNDNILPLLGVKI